MTLADPASTLDQAAVLERLGLQGDEFAERIFARCGVERRHVELDDAFLAMNLEGRTERVERELLRRAIVAVDRLDVDPRTIGAVFTSSLYSLGGPTLAHRLVEHYGMDPDTDKYHLTGVGCASAVPLLRLAGGSLQTLEGRPALIVAAESMSSILTRARSGDPRAKTVGSAIFGDGCAAMLLSGEQTSAGPAIEATKVHQIPNTLDAVRLATEHGETYLQLARELPDLAAAGLAGLVERFLEDAGLERTDIDHWIVHPGGRRIIEMARDALDLDDETLAPSWKTLAEHGNVGTPSIFYVLAATIEQRAPAHGERGLVVTVGPGVTVGLMLLQW